MNYFKISKYLLFASLACLLIVATGTLFPFIVGKYAWFRAMTGFSAIAFLLGLIFHEKEGNEYLARAKKVIMHPIGMFVTAFTLVMILASFFGQAVIQ